MIDFPVVTTPLKFLCCFLVCVSLTCGGRDLDRTQAAELIRDSQMFKEKKPFTLTFQNPFRAKEKNCADVTANAEDIVGQLVSQKLLTVQPTGQHNFGWLCLIVDADKTVKPLISKPRQGQIWGWGQETENDILVARRVLMVVTGINDAPDMPGKMVEFSWRFLKEPALASVDVEKLEIVKSAGGGLQNPRNGWAILQKYDDGWRVVRVNCGGIGE